MVGCASTHCTSRFEKGQKLYKFPADPQRRQIWIFNCGRPSIASLKTPFLCELHFERSQFELKRMDGKIKLKPNAIPTIFNYPDDENGIKTGSEVLITVLPPKHNVPEVSPEEFASSRVVGEHNYFNKKKTAPPEAENSFGCDDHPDDFYVPDDMDVAVPSSAKACEKCRDKSLEIRRLRRQVQVLNNQMENIEKTLGIFLNKDQKNALKLPPMSKAVAWSDEGLMDALKLRCVIGAEGYEHMRNICYPLPSVRTMYHRSKDGSGLGEVARGMLETCKADKKILRQVRHKKEMLRLERPTAGNCQQCGRRFRAKYRKRGRPLGGSSKKRQPKDQGLPSQLLVTDHPNDRYVMEQLSGANQEVQKPKRKRKRKVPPEAATTNAIHPEDDDNLGGYEECENRYQRQIKRPHLIQHTPQPIQQYVPPIVRIDQHVITTLPMPLVYRAPPEM